MDISYLSYKLNFIFSRYSAFIGGLFGPFFSYTEFKSKLRNTYPTNWLADLNKTHLPGPFFSGSFDISLMFCYVTCVQSPDNGLTKAVNETCDIGKSLISKLRLIIDTGYRSIDTFEHIQQVFCVRHTYLFFFTPTQLNDRVHLYMLLQHR